MTDQIARVQSIGKPTVGYRHVTLDNGMSVILFHKFEVSIGDKVEFTFKSNPGPFNFRRADEIGMLKNLRTNMEVVPS
jgi:hypothetical protein